MKIKVIDPQCEPFRKHESDAGIDLRASLDGPIILNGGIDKIDTGIQVAIPEGYCGLVVPRSGLGSEIGLSLANTVGIIDSSYRGNIFVNVTVKKSYRLHPGKRFAQLIVVPTYLEYEIVDDLDETERGDGGFGSTDEEVAVATSVTED